MEKWEHDNHLYISFHRIAVAKEAAGRGVAQTFLQGLIEGEKGPDFRCDTHPDNKVMQHLLEKLGFHYCGKVPIDGVRLLIEIQRKAAETSLFQGLAKMIVGTTVQNSLKWLGFIVHPIRVPWGPICCGGGGKPSWGSGFVTKPLWAGLEHIEEACQPLHEAVFWMAGSILYRGKNPSMPFPLFPQGSARPSQRVWACLAQIPYGGKSDLWRDCPALSCTRPSHRSSSRSESLLPIPCHRALGPEKKLTGYAVGPGSRVGCCNMRPYLGKE